MSETSAPGAQVIVEPEDDIVEVRRDGPLTAVIGIAAAALAIAYLARAAGSGGWPDWLLMGILGGVAAIYLTAFLDARAPLLLADQHGIRMRSGRTWRGVAWTEVDRLEHQPRRGLLSDGRIVVVSGDDRALTLRLSLATRLIGADWDELTDALRDLAGDSSEVVEPATSPEDEQPIDDDDDRPVPATPPDVPPEPESAPGEASARSAPSPLRRLVVGVRAEVRHLSEGATALKRQPDEVGSPGSLPEAAELRRDHEPDGTEWVDRVVPIGAPSAVRSDAPSDVEETVVIDDLGPARVSEPVIGPVLAGARTRLGLTVDQLADRTRIRPHVIESIEVDDFAPCGGDFYARGHLRTLARILGADATPLMRSYDEHYADAPIDPKRVFGAELATGVGGAIRGTRGGLNWSVLVAAVMAAVLVWAVARLIVDGPVPLDRAPVLNGSPSHVGQGTGAAPEVPVVFTAAGGGAKLKVRDGSGTVVFDGDLAFGQSASIDVSPPIRVWTSDGSVTATIDGDERGPMGETGEEASPTYVAR